MLPIWIEPCVDDPAQALPFVDIEVGGHQVRALLDSGAGRTTVVAFEGAPIELHPAEGTGVFGGQGERRVWHTTVKLGGRVVGPIGLDTREVDDGRDLLGQDVLSQFRCEYRFAEGFLVLDGPRPDEMHPIFLDEGKHVYLELAWPGATANAVLDTGASLSVVDRAFVDQNPDLFQYRGDSEGKDSAGRAAETPLVEMRGPTILGRTFASTVAAIVDLGPVNQTLERPMDLIIGWPILQQSNWVVDHADSSVSLTT